MNVYEAAMQRIERVFTDFDNVYVSFSGGKDSGVLLNLCVDYIRKYAPTRKLGVFHIDYEAQYQMTTDYVDTVLASNTDIFEVYRICLPLKAQCATSAWQSYWQPWQADKRDIWVRELPSNAISSPTDFAFWQEGMWDYDFQEAFGEWLHQQKGATRTACLVGIRTSESLNRWRAIHSERNYRNFEGLKWTRQVAAQVYNAYPVYDWATSDIWAANAQMGWEYNTLYDLMYQAGIPIDAMRVASPFNDAAIGSLHLYRAIDPDNWAKMVGRVNGANFAAMYGGTTAMGWKNITLPQGHTWESYMHFLLSTLPKSAADNYRQKLATSIQFWRDKGGVLAAETVEKLRQRGIAVQVGDKTAYKTDKKPVRLPYLDDIDIEEFQEIPTYKRVCICIMKNDHHCKYMGFSQTKREMEHRKAIIEKYNNLL